MKNSSPYSSVLSARAAGELEYAFIWYERQQEKLGHRFIENFESRINIICQNPELFSAKIKNYREANLEKFPYIVIYRINKGKRIVRILSVFHTSQNPEKKY